ncbi:MAG: hypothetical protein IPJ65_20900 [Archangiaceae bacterium]|nr:hypothetical protein [Archangiaceae bacterium]
MFSNITDPTGAVSYVLALPSEVGMWQATRLGPAASPTTITTIAYPEVVGGPCDPSFAHRVRVFKSASATPPAEPVVEDEVAVAGRSAPPAPALQVVVPLHRPLVLGTGEYLFVSVEMNGAGVSKPLGLCLAVNKNGTQHGLDFWSYAATAPFAWKDLKDDGIAGNVAIEAFGP